MTHQQCRLAFDVGGTFTDVVASDGRGSLIVEKVLSTPSAPELGARAGSEAALTRLGSRVDDVDVAIHGTTLVTNAIIERRGAVLGLLTTQGFEDTIEIGLGQRYDMYDLFLPFPAPLVERRLRLGVSERVCADGAELESLDEENTLRAVAGLVAEGVEALAICFLHAYMDSAHERLASALVHEAFPNLAVSVSSDVAGELGEYERFSTTLANAYVQPLVDRYLHKLDCWLGKAQLLMMGSNGGTISVEVARRKPILLLESGPAAGALAAAVHARRLRRDHVLSFDMGGTTAKVCLIDDGVPMMSGEFEAARAERFKPGSGIPIRIPTINLMEVGAGGGSIAQVNELGLLKVGPRSAGADPGPACYARGGVEPTVTDADVLLGYVEPSSFLGGEMTLDREAAVAAVDALAGTLGLGVIATAWGIHDMVNENMAAAMRSHIAERNRDPRHYSLFAFGGAGPVHAVAVARKVGIREVIVPLGAGVTSAVGLLAAPAAIDLVHSAPAKLSDVDWVAALAILAELEERARAELLLAKVPPDAVSVEWSADMRYVGQAHQITVPLPTSPTDPLVEVALRRSFHDSYRRLYSILNEAFDVELLTWRVRAAGPSTNPWFDAKPFGSRPRIGSRPTWQPAAHTFVDTRVCSHGAMDPNVWWGGPLVVEQPETTAIVGPPDRALVDTFGNLVIEIGG